MIFYNASARIYWIEQHSVKPMQVCEIDDARANELLAMSAFAAHVRSGELVILPSLDAPRPPSIDPRGAIHNAAQMRDHASTYDRYFDSPEEGKR